MQRHPKKLIKKARKITNTLIARGLSKSEARKEGIRLYQSIEKTAQGGQ
mgnify:CR=1 FL=1